MRVALCLFGQPRFIDRGYGALKPQIIDKYNADVYIHTYDSAKAADKPFHYGEGWKGQYLAAGDTDRYLALYNPYECIIDDNPDYTGEAIKYPRESTISQNFGGGYDSEEGWKRHIHASHSMWESIRKVIALASRRKASYDKIVLTRSDIGLGCVNLNIDEPYFEYESLGNPRLMNNWFNVMPHWEASRLATTVDQFEELYKENGGIWCNEMFMKQMADRNNFHTVERSWGLSIPSFRM